ncbi:hypothetical protein ACIB24_21615 [Spongisporangium articulatum]|uniref:Gcp-like domain-containing protein n=1 Tax=Spongisporangium articulatum TaxID=3362603 RepID=A0ABW8ATG3_9ACTN
MGLQLLMETSSFDYEVALRSATGSDGELGPVVAQNIRAEGFDGVAGLVSRCLAEARHGVADLESIVVDRGPGDLMSLRSGIAYANGLAYARKLPVAGFDSLELMARCVPEERPVLAVRKHARRTAFARLFVPGAAPQYVDGELDDLVEHVVGPAKVDDLVVLGAFRDELAERLGAEALAVDAPSVRQLADLLDEREPEFAVLARVITEADPMFSPVREPLRAER